MYIEEGYNMKHKCCTRLQKGEQCMHIKYILAVIQMFMLLGLYVLNQDYKQED